MIRRTPRSTLTATLFHSTTPFRSGPFPAAEPRLQFRRPPLGAMLRQNPAASGRRNSEATGFGDVEQSSQNVTAIFGDQNLGRSEEHTSELQSLMRISYAVFCLKKKTQQKTHNDPHKNNTYTP